MSYAITTDAIPAIAGLGAASILVASSSVIPIEGDWIVTFGKIVAAIPHVGMSFYFMVKADKRADKYELDNKRLHDRINEILEKNDDSKLELLRATAIAMTKMADVQSNSMQVQAESTKALGQIALIIKEIKRHEAHT